MAAPMFLIVTNPRPGRRATINVAVPVTDTWLASGKLGTFLSLVGSGSNRISVDIALTSYSYSGSSGLLACQILHSFHLAHRDQPFRDFHWGRWFINRCNTSRTFCAAAVVLDVQKPPNGLSV